MAKARGSEGGLFSTAGCPSIVNLIVFHDRDAPCEQVGAIPEFKLCALDVPHHDSIEAKAPAVRSRAGTVRERMIAPGDNVSPVEEFSGTRRAVVEEIIDLIRDGGAFGIRYLGSDA